MSLSVRDILYAALGIPAAAAVAARLALRRVQIHRSAWPAGHPGAAEGLAAGPAPGGRRRARLLRRARPPVDRARPGPGVLSGIPAGVTGIIEVQHGTRLTVRVFGSTGPAGLVSCAQLASVPDLGRCPAGAQVAAFPASSVVSGFSPIDSGNSLQGITWPAADITAQRLNAIGLDFIAVATNGSSAAIERARTVLDDAYPVPDGPQTLGELTTGGKAVSHTYQQLANIVIVTSLAIAGCTLATSIAAGLADRKRPFGMLRLTGARLATLRRVVVLESAVPLLAVAIVAIGAGFGASAMFTSAQMQHPLVGPGAGYYLIAAAGIVASLAIIAVTFPLLHFITGPEVARNE